MEKKNYIMKYRSESVGREREREREIMLCSLLDIFKSVQLVFFSTGQSVLLADEELKYERSFGSEVLIQMEMGTLQ